MRRLHYSIYILIALIVAAIIILTFYFVFNTKSSSIEVKLVPSPRSYCATRGHWDENTQSLYYVDIEGPDSTLLRYDYAEDKTYAATVANEPILTFVLPVANTSDQFLVGTKNQAVVIQWDGKSSKGEFVQTVFEISTDLAYAPNRFNGAKADPVGNFVGGTQFANDCSNHSTTAYLYHYDPKKGLTIIRSNLFISNGLTWSEKTNKFYFIDSCVPEVNEFDYDIETGSLCTDLAISNKLNNISIRFFFAANVRIAYTATPDLVLDGLTNDNDGNLFITTFGGSKILKVDPV